MPVSLLTATCALTTVGRAAPGETVLIHAGGGGLGTMAIEVARRLGLRAIATASAPETRARLAALGAELVFGYDDFEVGVRPLCHACGSTWSSTGWGATSSGAASSFWARSAGWSCSGCPAARRR